MRANRLGVQALALSLCVLLSGCHSCIPLSDAERAAQERKQVQEQLTGSLLVLPYRGMKTMIRASAVTPPPAHLVEVTKTYQDLSEKLWVDPQAAPDPATGPAETAGLAGKTAETGLVGKTTDLARQSELFVSLAAALFRSGAILYKEDEDRYPLLWEVARAGSVPTPYYGAEIEHLFVGVLELALYATAGQKPLIDWVYYELDRAGPRPNWPFELRLLSQLLRGAMFALGHKHYAAEEELNGYLAAVNNLSPAETASLREISDRGFAVRGAQFSLPLQPGLRAVGHLGRSFNRFALKRDGAAYADLEAALKILAELGVDNELTDWGQITLLLHKKDYAKAGQVLERLSHRPHLAAEDRAEVKQCAADLGKLDQDFVLFGRTRAQLVLARALLARLGGVKAFLVALGVLVGPQTADKLARTTQFLWSFSSTLAEESRRGETLDRGKKLGNKGYHFLRDQVGKYAD